MLDVRGRTVVGDLATVLLFGWTAECLTTSFAPELLTDTHLDLTSISLNVVGALLGGVARAVEGAEECSASSRRLARLFREGFVAVLTSFSWIVVHAAEIASAHETDQTSLLPVARRHHGLLFIASLIGCGLGAHAIGYGAGEAVMRIQLRQAPAATATRSITGRNGTRQPGGVCTHGPIFL